MIELQDVHEAARLLQWGLRTKDRPSQHEEYMRLVHRYEQEYAFSQLAHEMGRGLGVEILAVNEHGAVLTPLDGSIFAFRSSDFRQVRTADDRLLDGLVQIAIASTIFPRAADLDEEATRVRPPATVEEVEENLRNLCARLEEAARGKPDPTTSEEDAGLAEAWRAYQKRLSARETPDGRAAQKDTKQIIRTHFERLTELGCFLKEESEERVLYRPLWRYQVLVKEFAATRLHDRIRAQLLEAA